MPLDAQTYFGIRFTSEFPAGKEDRFRLAKVLYGRIIQCRE